MNVNVLLQRMRPRVEIILAECASMFEMPTCPSQHHRTVMALRHIEMEIGITPGMTRRKMRLIKIRSVLEDFDHVWSTVNIMEYPANHAWIEEELPGPQPPVEDHQKSTECEGRYLMSE